MPAQGEVASIAASNSIPADDIDLGQTVELIEDHLAPLAKALSEGEFALWIGSGISFGRAPGLPELVDAVIEFLRTRADASDAAEPHHRTLRTILRDHAKLSSAEVDAVPLASPFATWPEHARIVDALRNNYSPMLDERVQGQRPDYLLWNAVDVVARYGGLGEPDAEHAAIAILVLEGAITEMASGNWDGLIEAAVARMSPAGLDPVMRTIVEPGDARAHAADATLIKFHGCAVRCANDNDRFRPHLIATEAKMIEWANEEGVVQLELRRIATDYRSLVVGLSLQDGNLKDVFDKAKRAHPWALPAPPEPPAHVFCEDAIGAGQRTVLKLVYGDNFDADPDLVVQSALLRARPKTALPALALHVVCDKIATLATAAGAKFGAAGSAAFATGIAALRTGIGAAGPADSQDMNDFVARCVAAWSRCISLFRTGRPPPAGSTHYLAISQQRRALMMADPNIGTSGLPQFGMAIALIGHLVSDGTLKAALPANDQAALGATGTYPGATSRALTFVGNATAAFELQKNGAFEVPDAIFVHSDGAFIAALAKTGRSPSGARRSAARHVGISQLIDEADDYPRFRQRFLEEVAL